MSVDAFVPDSPIAIATKHLPSKHRVQRMNRRSVLRALGIGAAVGTQGYLSTGHQQIRTSSTSPMDGTFESRFDGEQCPESPLADATTRCYHLADGSGPYLAPEREMVERPGFVTSFVLNNPTEEALEFWPCGLFLWKITDYGPIHVGPSACSLQSSEVAAGEQVEFMVRTTPDDEEGLILGPGRYLAGVKTSHEGKTNESIQELTAALFDVIGPEPFELPVANLSAVPRSEWTAYPWSELIGLVPKPFDGPGVTVLKDPSILPPDHPEAQARWHFQFVSEDAPSSNPAVVLRRMVTDVPRFGAVVEALRPGVKGVLLAVRESDVGDFLSRIPGYGSPPDRTARPAHYVYDNLSFRAVARWKPMDD